MEQLAEGSVLAEPTNSFKGNKWKVLFFKKLPSLVLHHPPVKIACSDRGGKFTASLPMGEFLI